MTDTHAFTLYLPFTFAENNGKPGVTLPIILNSIQQLNWGTISQIQMQPPTPPLPPDSNFTFIDKKGNKVRSWFVHYATWTPPTSIDIQLQSGGRIDLPYDNLGHFWQLKKYIPRENLAKNNFTFELAPLENSTYYKTRGLVPPEMALDYSRFDYQNDIKNELTWEGNQITLPGHLTEQEIDILDQTNDVLEYHYYLNSHGLIHKNI